MPILYYILRPEYNCFRTFMRILHGHLTTECLHEIQYQKEDFDNSQNSQGIYIYFFLID